jgi:hypothetical protein
MFNKIKLLHNWLETNSFSDEAYALKAIFNEPSDLLKIAGVFEPPPKILEQIYDRGEKIWMEFLLSWTKVKRKSLDRYSKRNIEDIIEHNKDVFSEKGLLGKIRRRWTGPPRGHDVFYNEDPKYIWEKIIYYGSHSIELESEDEDSYPETVYINDRMPSLTTHHPAKHFKKSAILFRALTRQEIEQSWLDSDETNSFYWVIHDPTGDRYRALAEGDIPDAPEEKTSYGRPTDATGPLTEQELIDYISEIKEYHSEELEYMILEHLKDADKRLAEVESLADGGAPPQSSAGYNWFDANTEMELPINADFSNWKYTRNLKTKDEEGNPKKIDPNDLFSHKIRLNVYKNKKDVKVACDGDAMGCWDSSSWSIHIWTGEFKDSAEEMRSLLDRFKKTLRHEAQHLAQDALRVILKPEISHGHNPIGMPRGSVRHRQLVTPSGLLKAPVTGVAPFPMESDDRWGRIRHELRDVEFMPRVLDEVGYFLESLDLDGSSPGSGSDRWPGKIPAEFWRLAIKHFTLMAPDVIDVAGEMRKIRENNNYFSNRDRSSGRTSTGDPVGVAANIPGMAQGNEYSNWARNFTQSHWFKYLHHYDKPRWKEAVFKFVGELDRLGILSMIPRTQRWTPVVPSQREEWGKSFIRSTDSKRKTSYSDSREERGEEWAEMLPQWIREYDEFIASLSDVQLKRHKLLVLDSNDSEYWVTPRWREWDGKGEIEHHGGNVPEHPRLR